MCLLVNRCDDAYLAVKVDDDQVKVDSYITLSQPGPEQKDLDLSVVQDDQCTSEISVLKVQLKQAEEKAQKVQREVTSTC